MNYNKTVTVVGLGIDGLLTMWKAVEKGYHAIGYSKSPEPAIHLRHDADWADRHASTFNSRNDQRYVTVFEGQPYLHLDGYMNTTYPNIVEDFVQEVLEGGFLAKPMHAFNKGSRNWLIRRLQLNLQLKKRLCKPVERVTKLFNDYVYENIYGLNEWYNIFQMALTEAPELIDQLDLDCQGVLRLYTDSSMLQESIESHKRFSVFIRALAPALLSQEFPAYASGVASNFIQGGGIETHGLTFGVQSFCVYLIQKLREKGAALHFNKEVEEIVLDPTSKHVMGIKIKGSNTLHCSNFYSFHPGAYAGPELFANIQEAKDQLAAVEGYWITLKNVPLLLKQMKYRSSKIHGKSDLETLIGKVETSSQAHYVGVYKSLGIDPKDLKHLAPVIDFNNMPIEYNGYPSLGCGSGYLFKGLAERDERGELLFAENVDAEKFILNTMRLWLEVLHGKAIMDQSEVIIHPHGCKRSWTVDDQELDVNLLTKDGGLLMIHGGGNTGTTSKAPFTAAYITQKMALMQEVHTFHQPPDQAYLSELFSSSKVALRDQVASLSEEHWQKQRAGLQQIIDKAKMASGGPRR